MKRNSWPVLRTYDQNHLARIALPLGGIGTGTVSLGGRGDLRDWEIMNRPAKGFLPAYAAYVSNVAPPVFILYAQPDGAPAVTRALEGPLELAEYEGPRGCRTGNHGLPRFRHASFAAAYPLGQVLLSDPAVPVDVRLEAFNPLIPGDADDSGIPVAVLRYVLTNKTGRRVTASVCGNVPNFIGADGSTTTRVWGDVDVPTGTKDNRNTYRQTAKLRGIFMDSGGVDPQLGALGHHRAGHHGHDRHHVPHGVGHAFVGRLAFSISGTISPPTASWRIAPRIPAMTPLSPRWR